MVSNDGGIDSLGGEVRDRIVNSYPVACPNYLYIFFLVVVLCLQCKGAECKQYNCQNLLHDNWLRIDGCKSIWKFFTVSGGVCEAGQSGRD